MPSKKSTRFFAQSVLRQYRGDAKGTGKGQGTFRFYNDIWVFWINSFRMSGVASWVQRTAQIATDRPSN